MNPSHHDELFLALGRLEGKVDALISLQQYQQNQLIEHDKRLRTLEHLRGYLLGWAVALGAAVTIFTNLLIKFVN